MSDYPLTDGYTTRPATRFDSGTVELRSETLAEEAAIALVYNGISHAVMMATPLDLEDFALGFSLTEGILTRREELYDLDITHGERGITLDMRIAEPRFLAMKDTRRTLAGRTGCGLCGQDSLEHAIRPVPRVESGVHIRPQDVSTALASLAAQQPLNQATGAVHAAGAWHAGQLTVREDVGRHNALDKLIGALLHARMSPPPLLVMSSRASYEIIYKAAIAGIPVIAAISAPTAMALRMADEAGITLIGFARDTRMTVYTHPERIDPHA
ncbi:MAG: formate dehydrogenase accessory sulfurtransferase FdhD [Burkholderiales bacterium]|nr:formate dehydrogenase accessory sulfurtransferase FdhD [Burkholderiales bacterium]